VIGQAAVIDPQTDLVEHPPSGRWGQRSRGRRDEATRERLLEIEHRRRVLCAVGCYASGQRVDHMLNVGLARDRDVAGGDRLTQPVVLPALSDVWARVERARLRLLHRADPWFPGPHHGTAGL